MQKIIDRTHQYMPKGRWYTRYLKDITQIVVHHSAYRFNNQSNDQRLKTLMSFHTNQNWPGLAYHYVILKGGQIYKINNHEDLTWTDFDNVHSLSILVDGHFHHHDQPTNNQLKSLDWLLTKLVNEHPEFPAVRKDVKGHREVLATIQKGGTACPGDNLFKYVKEWRDTGQIHKISIIDNNTNDNTDIITNNNTNTSVSTSTNNNTMSIQAVEKSNLSQDDKQYILSDIDNNLTDYINARKNEIEELKAKNNFHIQSEEQLNDWIIKWGMARLSELGKGDYVDLDLYNSVVDDLEATKLELEKEKKKRPSSSQKRWYESKKFIALIIGVVGLVAVNYFGSDLILPYVGTVITYILGQSYADGGAGLAQTITESLQDGKLSPAEITKILKKINEDGKTTNS